ncbi:hypothetical protein F5146DRAFT_1006380 [Armillaria mellea]|nr:hypothetical protein F5146DRAFT_1006380 [Armillaria mellea]
MQVDLPPDVTSTDVTSILSILDNEINRLLLAAHLQGMYSGILAVALWTIFTIIIIVYVMTFASFSLNWLTVRSVLVANGENILTQVTRIEEKETAVILATGIMAALSTLLVDSIMIWHCWLVWGQCWQIILLPSVMDIRPYMEETINPRTDSPTRPPVEEDFNLTEELEPLIVPTDTEDIEDESVQTVIHQWPTCSPLYTFARHAGLRERRDRALEILKGSL